MGFEVRAHFVQGPEDPRLYVHGVKVVQEEEVGDQLVFQQGILEFPATQFRNILYDAGQTLTVKLQ